jgi:hypothetical protein
MSSNDQLAATAAMVAAQQSADHAAKTESETATLLVERRLLTPISPILAPLFVGRQVHYWMPVATPQFVRNDHQPFTAKVCFVHPDGDVTVCYHDHYGVTHIESHVPICDVRSDTRHGHGDAQGAYCTWPLRI